jgi:heterodisulfide reductase subunit A2
MTIKIGCYVCHCGINIAGRVRVDEVSAYARNLQGVVVSRDYKFMCSDPGQEMIEKDIRAFGLNRVVVASCSPRLHEKTFQGACQRAGINPYLFQMASVREQVSWVTGDSDEATRKAKTLVAAAVNRVSFHEQLETRQVPVHPDIMVLGAGIAGMQAALDIGRAGNKVYLVEKAPTIGGHMLQFDKTFPTLDCAACIGTPKMVEVAQQAHIELLTYSEVTDVSGYIGNYTVTVHRRPRYVTEGVCTGCGECAKVCPISRPSEWDVGLQQRRAIYRSFPQAVPIAYVIDKRGTAPCKATCPAHVSIQGYIALINQGKYREALDLFREQHPFPGVCGRVCHHPCEGNCTRNDVDQPLAIRELHRFLADWERQTGARSAAQTPAAGNQKVAIVGSGPAGLSAAAFLALKGYAVTIFEKLPTAGGMMAVGIPEYRLPRDILAEEIALIEGMGVTIRTGVTFGEHITLETLRQEGFDALFLAVGLHGGRRLGIENEDAAGVLQGVDFLRDAALGKAVPIGSEVLVIGGGNVAVDVALTARRKGASKVTLICLEKRNQMPAWEHEIREALDSDILIVNSFGPKAFFINKDNHVSGLEFKSCTAVFDATGRFNPSYDEDACQPYFADTVIVAIGQSAQLDFASAQGIAVTPRGGLQADPETLQTPLEWVFAGGDAVYGPKSVVEAVACGKTAAESIYRYLNGMDLKEGRDKPWAFEKPEVVDTPVKQRVPVRCLDPADRECNFLEVSQGYSEEEARREAARCLECGICSECYQCEKVCQPKAINHQMQPQDREIKVGSIILATGFDLMDAAPLKPYGYGTYPNVFTSLEFERLNNATGPTGGKILMRDAAGNFTGKPDSVAVLHCIGSRDVNYHEYCSRVCCMYALKYTHLIKEKVGHDTRVYDFFIDQRCYGKGYEAFYRRCQEEGTTFIRGKVAELTDQAQSAAEQGKLIAIAEDTLLGRRIRVPVDMVVLCLAMEARADTGDVGRIFGVNQGADGFFLEEHPKLAPLSTATDGVFLAGACQGPKDIPDTVAQASGAAAKALALSHRGVVEVPSAISWIDPDICAGCQVCIGLCPYGAIEFDPRRLVSEVNEALCKGCGSCAGFCPSSAAQTRHFRPGQVMAELDGIFDAISQVGI